MQQNYISVKHNPPYRAHGRLPHARQNTLFLGFNNSIRGHSTQRGKVNQGKMIEWVLRQYFNPETNKSSKWYSPDVTEHNVLEYVAQTKNNFPLTPRQLLDMWITIEGFKKSLKKAEKNYGPDLGLLTFPAKEIPINLPPQTKYQMGETTLKSIGALLGGLTPTMINKLGTSGMDKFRALTSGVSPEKMDEAELLKLNDNIFKCRQVAAREFAGDLKRTSGRTKTFITLLVKKHIITQNDVKIMEDAEVAALTILSTHSQEEIIRRLLKDISSSDNVFKTFQSAVTKKAFPEKKRGRPRKEPKQDLMAAM